MSINGTPEKTAEVLEVMAKCFGTTLASMLGYTQLPEYCKSVSMLRRIVKSDYVAWAHTVLAFTQENLKLLQGYPYIFMYSQRDKNKISSLDKTIKVLQSFFEWAQETFPQHLLAAATIYLFVDVVQEILDSTDSYIGAYVIKKEKNLNPSCFLQYSPPFSKMARHLEEMIFFWRLMYVSSEGSKNSFGGRSLSQGACSPQSPYYLSRWFHELIFVDGSPSGNSSISVAEESTVVGFEHEAKELQNKLIGGWKQLEVTSISGMAGIGKTTLANKLYNDLTIVRHFHICAWTSVSQSYQKRKLLHNILSCIIGENDPVFTMSDEDIGHKLYKCLKNRRYLIVIDDIWDTQAWNELEMYFPRDEECSRILITSRVEDAALEITPGRPPFILNFRSRAESWDLFKRKVFPNQSFPEDLVDIGLEIVAKCQGLPLAIVIIAGLLAQGEKTERWWRQVAEDIGSFVNSNSEQFKDSLALSYTHLPSHLKSCFLYLGTFPEDYEIPARTIIKSWIAEGFIFPIAGKRLEDVAEEHLKNLISRNLVMVAKRRSNGGIKSCKMHDLIRDLTLQKAPEKTFMQPICICPRSASSFDPEGDNFSNCHYLHFLDSYSVAQRYVFHEETLSFYMFLRRLDLRQISLYKYFPEGITNLIHLKYLALHVDRIEDLPHSIFELWRLETFILDGEKSGRVTLNTDVMKMVGLRHLEISQELVCGEGWESFYEGAYFVHLQTISQLSPLGSSKNFLSRAPNLRKLSLYLSLSEMVEPFAFPDLSTLDQLETLKFEYHTSGKMPFSIRYPNVLPPSLKQLTLIGSHANWEEMSILGGLPNLEVLKLKHNFFSGSKWETSDGWFRRLKFLKLSHMDLQEWISDASHFPTLEQLVLSGCLNLMKIPSEFEEITTLQTIKVYGSSDSSVKSAREIQEAQTGYGNKELKVFLYQG